MACGMPCFMAGYVWRRLKSNNTATSLTATSWLVPRQRACRAACCCHLPPFCYDDVDVVMAIVVIPLSCRGNEREDDGR
jgi:hypothetical protein